MAQRRRKLLAPKKQDAASRPWHGTRLPDFYSSAWDEAGAALSLSSVAGDSA
jgi:hypothetical protein